MVSAYVHAKGVFLAKSLLSDFNPKSIFGDYFPGGRGLVSAYVHAKDVFLAKSLLSDFNPKSIFGDYFPGGRGWVSAWVQSVSPRGLRWLTLVTLVNADYAG